MGMCRLRGAILHAGIRLTPLPPEAWEAATTQPRVKPGGYRREKRRPEPVLSERKAVGHSSLQAGSDLSLSPPTPRATLRSALGCFVPGFQPSILTTPALPSRYLSPSAKPGLDPASICRKTLTHLGYGGVGRLLLTVLSATVLSDEFDPYNSLKLRQINVSSQLTCFVSYVPLTPP